MKSRANMGIKIIFHYRILKAAEANGVTITTEQVNKMKIHRTALRNMVNKGLLDHAARGIYILPTKLDDDL